MKSLSSVRRVAASAGQAGSRPSRLAPQASASPLRGPGRGFTLVELMITLAVVGILAAVAYPSFMDQIRKSRRSDAINALTAVQQAQERWRANRPAFTGNLTSSPTSDPPDSAGLGLSASSPAGLYSIAISAADASSYVVTATANPDKSQASDGNCLRMAVRMQNGNIGYGAGASGIDWADPHRCWVR